MSFWESPSFTQVPNKFFDEVMPTLKEGEIKVILAIMRQTFGWGNKEFDWICLNQMCDKTGLSKSTVCIAIDSLIKKNLIIKKIEGTFGNERIYYGLGIKKEDQSEIHTPPVRNSDPGGTKFVHTKETLTKETLTKDIHPSIPSLKEEIPKPAFNPELDGRMLLSSLKEKMQALEVKFECSKGSMHSFDQQTKEMLIRNYSIDQINGMIDYMSDYYEKSVPESPIGLAIKAIKNGWMGRSESDKSCLEHFYIQKKKHDLNSLHAFESYIIDTKTEKDLVFKGMSLNQFIIKFDDLFIKPLSNPSWKGL